MEEALPVRGNPSSLHTEGRSAAKLLEKARKRLAGLIGARPGELTFTSGGTESNAWALEGLAAAHRGRGNRLIVSAVEHLSVLQTVQRLEKEGWTVLLLPADKTGRIDPGKLEAALTPDTALVSIQWANPEVGTLQPVAELARLVKARGVLFHTDAVAAAGRVSVNVQQVPVDALSLASGPLGGPHGAGALYLRQGVRIQPLLLGGTQEGGRRAGTENLIGLAGFGAAAEESAAALGPFPAKVAPLLDRLVRGILNLLPEAQFNGHPTERLPGHLSVSFPSADAEALVLALDREGVSVGLGSACSARSVKASHVLKALGLPDSLALGTVTLTLDAQVTLEQVEQFLSGALPRALRVIGKEPIRG